MRTLPLISLVLVLLAAPATAYERSEIKTKDRVLGTITADQRTHEYSIDIPRDAVFTMALPKVKGSRLIGSMGVLDEQYNGVPLFLIGKRKVQLQSPPRASGTFRALVQGVSESEGDYLLKPKMKVRKRYKIKGRRSDLAPPGRITFGALAGYQVQVKVKWSGPEPVTIASFTDPDGGDMTSAIPAKEKKSSFAQKGFEVAKTGDHEVVLGIPPSANSWSLLVTLKGKSVGVVHQLREVHSVPAGLELLVTNGPNPMVRIVGESGGGNDFVLGGGGRQPTVFGVFPDPPEQCVITPSDGSGSPAGYTVVCDETHSAEVVVGDRDGNRTILDYVADPVVGPGGSGTVEFTEFIYQGVGSPRLDGWTEFRTFDTSGNRHKLVIYDVRRFGAGGFAYSVEHTDPDGAVRNYDYLPFN